MCENVYEKDICVRINCDYDSVEMYSVDSCDWEFNFK